MKLNPEQIKAVECTTGAAMIIAGAGCGKTRVITQRISNLVKNHGVAASSILALTFTNKAAKEMAERIEKELGSDFEGKPFLGTFHSYCFFLLRRHASLFGLDNFGVLDSTDQTTLIKKILTKFGLEREFQAREILSYISGIKNKMFIEKEPMPNERNKKQELFKEYEREKIASKNLDFDDLIIKVFDKLSTDESFLELVRSRITHILVDEYQDTNVIQHGLIKLLACGKSGTKVLVDSVFAVGDQDQSIYSWRGAVAENVNHFLKSFENTKLLKIQQNYRSPQQILNAANKVISNNRSRQEKKLWSEINKKNCIFLARCKNEYQEAEIIANSLTSYRQEKSSSRAVLYRNHYQSRLVEEALINNRIQYVIIGGIKFYERKEIKDLLAYLKLTVNVQDWISLGRVINTPTRGLGGKALEKIDEELAQTNYTSFSDLLKAVQPILLQKKQRENVESFCETFIMPEETLRPSEVLQHILDKTKYFEYLEKEYDEDEAETKIDNCLELQKSIKSFEINFDGQASVKNFLEEIALIQEADTKNVDPNSPTVQLMTLHSAKGLEFDFVTILGLEEGTLPSLRRNNPEDLEEERRLTYVGMTRAKDKLLLCSCESRSEFGRVNYYNASRFIEEIPAELMIQSKQNQNTQLLKREIGGWIQNKITEEHCNNISFDPQFSKPNTFRSEFKFNSWSSDKKRTETIPSKTILKPAFKQTIKTGSFFVGQMVSHQNFGPGIIKKVSGDGDSTILEISFLKGGIKKINSKFINK